MSTAVIVGSSVGGVRTAQALRSEGWTGRLLLVGEEAHLPYDRPPLSKRMLSELGACVPSPLLTPAEARDSGIELLLGHRAAALEPQTHKVLLNDGLALDYDELVIATGAVARPSPWGDHSGLHLLRNLDDCTALRNALHGSAADAHVVVIGGGFIGSEVAAACRALDRQVTIVDPLDAPLGRIVGADVGAHLTALHRRHGVTTRFGVGVSRLTPDDDGRFSILLTDGGRLTATTVVVGIGAMPNVEWLAGSGLPVDDGVLCDATGAVAEAAGISAVGDVARWYDPVAGVHRRVEHWTNAVEQAAVVAARLCGSDTIAGPPEDYVWSDLHDWKTQIVGRPHLARSSTFVGSWHPADARGAVLYVSCDGRLVGAVTVNWPRALLACRRVLQRQGRSDDALMQIEMLGTTGATATTSSVTHRSEHPTTAGG